MHDRCNCSLQVFVMHVHAHEFNLISINKTDLLAFGMEFNYSIYTQRCKLG